ncbi:MAG: peptidoglycan editing factor PgeF [Anaerolineae bacterium]|nr:peptidoglycan editing factor PgeF [Anaerolineae bacterium]
MILRHQHNGLVWYEFTEPPQEFRHALLTRIGGVSEGHCASLNLGSTVRDDPDAVVENHRRAFQAFGVTRDQIVSPYQVHGNHVARVGRTDGGSVIAATDALICQEPGVALLLRFADCAPVLFYDPIHRAIGLAHAGWRGVVAGIVPATIQAMQTAFDTASEDLWAGIGPAIGPEHYAVGPEVVEAISATLAPETQVAPQREGQWFLDLPKAVEAQLRLAGVQQIARSGLDTAGNTDEWYSHRAEAGRTGRFGVLVMMG